MLVKDYVKGCRTLEDVKRSLVKALTKGNCFLYMHEPEQYEAEKVKAEELAGKMIEEQLHTLPKKFREEIDVSSFMRMANAIVDSRKERRY